MAALDQPTFDGVNTYVVSGQARAAGLTVALSGIGGDELFAGYDTFRIATQLERIRRLMPRTAGPLAAAVTRVALNDNDRGRKLARWLTAREQGLCATGLRRELFAPHTVAGLLGGHPPRGGGSEPASDLADPVNRVSFQELDRYMRNVLLRDADVLSMAHSLEVRVPFLDHELVELVAGMPGTLKVQNSTPKPLLVGAVADLLPPEVVHRSKRGFALPFPVWLRGPLRGEVEAALLDPDYGGQVASLLDSTAVAAVWQRFLDGRAEWVRPWSLYALKTWGEARLPVNAAAPTKLKP
jgi:asparagine synthase (glutamine-hydrolysing)